LNKCLTISGDFDMTVAKAGWERASLALMRSLGSFSSIALSRSKACQVTVLGEVESKLAEIVIDDALSVLPNDLLVGRPSERNEAGESG